jgi:hypothetical protein
MRSRLPLQDYANAWRGLLHSYRPLVEVHRDYSAERTMVLADMLPPVSIRGQSYRANGCAQSKSGTADEPPLELQTREDVTGTVKGAIYSPGVSCDVLRGSNVVELAVGELGSFSNVAPQS